MHVDVDPTSISKTIKAHIPVVGCLATVFEQLLSAINASSERIDRAAQEVWWEEITKWRAQKCLSYETNNEVLKPQTVIEKVYEITNGDAFVCSDVGQHQMFAAQYYPFKNPRQWINSGGLGTMGFGLPAAMGVKLAFPDKESICVTGDGSIQMNIQELSTCLQYNLAVKVVSLNNRSLGMVRQWQDMMYSGRHSSSYMDSLPDFVKLAESYGHVGIRVDTLDQLQPAIEKAMSINDRLVFLDICVDEKEHVYPMQIKLGAVDEMWLRKGVKA